MRNEDKAPVEATARSVEQVARELRKGAPKPKRSDVLIDYTYRKNRGEYVTIALNNDTALNLSASAVARLIELSQRSGGKKV
jgi:hypothetical protein